MNSTQLNQFYNSTNPDNSTNETFGYWLAKTLQDMSQQFNCSNTTNCSSNELALKQWGSSYITRNGQIYDSVYTPRKNSITNWGQYPTPGAPIHPEFYYYAIQTGSGFYPLNETQC